MPELEDQLTGLAAAIEWPETPARLWRGGRQRRPEGLTWLGLRPQRWALAAAAALLIVAALLAYTPSRDAIAGWVNVHTGIHRAPVLPTPTAHPSGPLGARLQLGTQTTLAGAQQQVAWHVVVPASLGSPDEVYVKQPPTGPSGGEVTLVYAARPDIHVSGLTGVSVLVTEARGGVEEQFFQKTLGPDVTIEQVSVGGRTGYWISGSPHAFMFSAADGTPYYDTLRLATNTLIFDDGGMVVRIEGDMSKQQAIDIGRSLA